jgi:hypothetical protein
MILKIRRNYGNNWSEVPEKIIECDEFDRREYDESDNKAEAAELMFCDEAGEVHPVYTIVTYRNRKFAGMYILGHATVFVMNNEGKTVDTIYT